MAKNFNCVRAVWGNKARPCVVCGLITVCVNQDPETRKLWGLCGSCEPSFVKMQNHARKQPTWVIYDIGLVMLASRRQMAKGKATRLDGGRQDIF